MNIAPHIHRILDLARWAPSGDNTQPWRFEILGDEHVLVHGLDTRDHVVYDLDGHASQLAVGALLETMEIAASTEKRRVRIERRAGTPENHLLIDVRFEPDDTLISDRLAEWIKKRSVQRRAMSTRRLTGDQKSELALALPEGYRVRWFESLPERWHMAKFMFDNAKVRLTIPEAYEVHKSVIEWGVQFSNDRIPDQAVGVDSVTARFMRWLMADWNRVRFFNTWLMGHLPPRIQLDLLPGLGCAAHFSLHAPFPMRDVDDFLAAGRVMQRFWLTATGLNFYAQPEMTPVIFTRYHRQAIPFTVVESARTLVSRLNSRLAEVIDGEDVETLFFIGRIGTNQGPRSRSLRIPLDSLLLEK